MENQIYKDYQIKPSVLATGQPVYEATSLTKSFSFFRPTVALLKQAIDFYCSKIIDYEQADQNN